MEQIITTKEAIQAAFTEWFRRYSEDPEAFQEASAILLDPEQDEFTYGEEVTPYFLSILEGVGK